MLPINNKTYATRSIHTAIPLRKGIEIIMLNTATIARMKLIQKIPFDGADNFI